MLPRNCAASKDLPHPIHIRPDTLRQQVVGHGAGEAGLSQIAAQAGAEDGEFGGNVGWGGSRFLGHGPGQALTFVQKSVAGGVVHAVRVLPVEGQEAEEQIAGGGVGLVGGHGSPIASPWRDAVNLDRMSKRDQSTRIEISMNSNDVNILVSAAQIRAARALADISQDDLVKLSGVSKATIADFERGNRSLQPRTQRDLVNAFVSLGIVFHRDETQGLVGVSLRVEAGRRVD